MSDYFRHGDVFIIETKEIPDGALPIEEKVLEYGEVTGHAHRLDESIPGTQVYQTKNGAKYLRVIHPTNLRHEEHETRTIPPGIYEIRRTRETDHMSRVTRILAD